MRTWLRFCLIAVYPRIDPTLGHCGDLATKSNAQLLTMSTAAETIFLGFATWLSINGLTSASIRTYITGVRSTLLDWSGVPLSLSVEWRRLPRLLKGLKWIFQESAKPRIPVLQQHLLRIRGHLDFAILDDLAFFCALLLGWNGLLRCLAPSFPPLPPHPLLLSLALRARHDCPSGTSLD